MPFRTLLSTQAQLPVFFRAINLNGSAQTIDGYSWEASAGAANFSTSGGVNASANWTPSPAVDAATKAMLNSGLYGDSLTFTFSNVPNGTYTVFVWSGESDQANGRSMNFTLQGQSVATNVGNLPLYGWAKNGGYVATVAGGTLTLQVARVQGGLPAIVSGISIFKNS